MVSVDLTTLLFKLNLQPQCQNQVDVIIVSDAYILVSRIISVSNAIA